MYCDAVCNRPAAKCGIVVGRCVGETECCYLRNARDDQKLTTVTASGGDTVTVPDACRIVGCNPGVVACGRRSEGVRSRALRGRSWTNLHGIGAKRLDKTARRAGRVRWRRAEWTVNVEGHSAIHSRSSTQRHSRSVSRGTA